MEKILVAVFVLVVLFLIFIVFGVVAHFRARKVIPNKYEWLLVLSHAEWKTTLQIRKEMEKIKNTSQGAWLVYSDLNELEEEKFIEERLGVPRVIAGSTFETIEYRLTPKGSRKKLDVGMTECREKDLRPQTT